MKKGLLFSLLTVVMIGLGGCATEKTTPTVKEEPSKESKQEQNAKVQASSKISNIVSQSAKISSISSNSSSTKKNVKDLYTAKNLTTEQRRKIETQLGEFCTKRAEMGNMAYQNHLADMSGWGYPGYREYSTVDGPVTALDAPDSTVNDPWEPTTGEINYVAGGTFFKHKKGLIGKQEKGSCLATYGEYMADDSDTHLYLFADNGKVYEAKVTGPVRRGGGFEEEYEVSKDQAVIDEYQRLLKEAGGKRASEVEVKELSKEEKLNQIISHYYAEQGYYFEPAELKNGEYGETIVTPGMTYFADTAKMPKEICQGKTLKLDGQDFKFNFDNSQGQYKVIAAYGPTMTDWTKNIDRIIFVVKDGKNYTFKVEPDGNLTDISNSKFGKQLAQLNFE